MIFRFNLAELQSALPTSQSSQIISSLHAILKPFLLRRLQVDVEFNLPPKKEYVLYAPLSICQREAYNRVLDGGLRKWLIHGGTGGDDIVKDKTERTRPMWTSLCQTRTKMTKMRMGEKAQKPHTSKRSIKGRRKSYNVDGDDDEYFEMLEQGHFDEHSLKIVI
jgi:ATP-dependent DNA helicase